MNQEDIEYKNYEELRQLVVNDFGEDCLNNPTAIFNDIEDYKKRIDEPITELKSILVKDDRARGGYYWDGLADEERLPFIHYTPIHGSDEYPITIKKIINTLQKDEHYSHEWVIEDNHNFLEGYDWINPYVLSFYYGS